MGVNHMRISCWYEFWFISINTNKRLTVTSLHNVVNTIFKKVFKVIWQNIEVRGSDLFPGNGLLLLTFLILLQNKATWEFMYLASW